MALDTYALTTLANLKEVLGITDSTQDTALEHTINRASAVVEGVLGKPVLQRTVEEWFDLDGSGIVMLSAPVASVLAVATGLENALFLRVTDSTVIDAAVSVTATAAAVAVTDSAGTTTTTTAAFATYPTIATVATALDAAAGVSCEALRTGRSTMLRPQGGVSVKNGAYIGMASPDDSAGWSLDRDTGKLSIDLRFRGFPEDFDDPTIIRAGLLPPTGPQRVFVRYTHGYSTVPYDIEQAALEVATAIWTQRGSDTTLQSETLGSYSYARGSERSLRRIAYELLSSRAVIR